MDNIILFGFLWHEKRDLFRVIEDSRLIGKVLGALNSKLLALIPKKNEINSFDGYKAISLCKLVYKTITNILVNKLKRILSGCFSKE